jgi:hypothetical protein
VMADAPKEALPSVLIIENENGEVYIVEDSYQRSQIEKILKSSKPRATRASTLKNQNVEQLKSKISFIK